MYSPALSVSRMNDYESCPLKFRYRTIDRIPEPPSSAATKGTLVHSVLEHLYDLPANARTVRAAQDLLEPRWAALLDRDPQLADLFAEEDFDAWMSSARTLVATYFERENPAGLSPLASNRERMITVDIGSVRFRGIIDRIDVAPNGDMRIVDYKTGKMPGPAYRESALLQLRVYGLMLSLVEGKAPVQSQLIYLGSNDTLTYWTDEADNDRAAAKIEAVWAAIMHSLENGFEPRKSPLCNWCSFQNICPLFGGEIPDMPGEGVTRLRKIELSGEQDTPGQEALPQP